MIDPGLVCFVYSQTKEDRVVYEQCLPCNSQMDSSVARSDEHNTIPSSGGTDVS